MKYAKEVIELMGAHPGRSFRMMDIVNYAVGKGGSRKEREAGRKAIGRVLKALEEGGSLEHVRSAQGRGGYSLYRLKAYSKGHGVQAPQNPNGWGKGYMGCSCGAGL